MKKHTLATTILTLALASASQAAVIATTSYEAAEGFTNAVTGGYSVTTGGALWTSGDAGNYAGVWDGMASEPDGAFTAVIGNAGHWLAVDPTGSGGVGTMSFQWDEYSGSSAGGSFSVQWTTDVINGTETWTTAESIAQTGAANSGFIQENVVIDQAGDVKVRIVMDAGSGNGSSFDLMSVTDFTPVPEPSSTALLGLGGLALILRRRK